MLHALKFPGRWQSVLRSGQKEHEEAPESAADVSSMQATLQNLRDAGCGPRLAERFFRWKGAVACRSSCGFSPRIGSGCLSGCAGRKGAWTAWII
ncbi:hypothetical protein DPQ25_05060 [Hydrogeniiclostridium mannosilyticum]|uniref:Uncharacterized protein n=1 Tax=Hydrogeniiclostridium mannosilyticum TaxID=2764322 RepID=A0A328UL42_9FIRM|nr:hypothetical protein DPQ25_05060 [Hydrogeniiclostridium mannosilyticum]